MKKLASLFTSILFSCNLAFANPPYDKEAHFGASFALNTVFYGVYKSMGLSQDKALFLSTLTTFGIGLAKEIHDLHSTGNRFDYGDMTANALGFSAAVISVKLFKF